MITIQKVTSNVQSVPPPVSRHLLTRRTVFSKTVFSIARSTFKMYSVMKQFKILCFLRVFFTVIVRCTETFWSLCIQCGVELVVSSSIILVQNFVKIGHQLRNLTWESRHTDSMAVFLETYVGLKKNTGIRYCPQWVLNQRFHRSNGRRQSADSERCAVSMRELVLVLLLLLLWAG
jgi:hypothetical protein